MDSDFRWYIGLSAQGMDFGLGRVTEILSRLGNPHRIRCVHVAGTDGKGSVCAMTESALRSAGFRTGMFVSPEILKVNECIRIDGVPISDADLGYALGEVRRVADECTAFEALTAAAFLHFRRAGVEIAVVEVGMGGRLDSTNVVSPDVTVINNISREHTKYLGDTVEEIAYEKGGIMKSGVPCVTLNNDAVYRVLESIAEDVGCEIVRVTDADISILNEDCTSVTMEYRGNRYDVGLPGRHQARNAALAIEALEILDISHEHIRHGLSSVRWPCRMEKIGKMVIDVTHTVSGAKCLREDVGRIYGKVTLVLGMLAGKDADGVSAELIPIASSVIVTQPPSPRARLAESLAEIVSRYGDVAAVIPDISEALDMAVRLRGETVILVTGSVRMAEGALRWIG